MRPPRPNEFRDRWCGTPRGEDAGSQVRVAGWVHRRRDHGGLVFIDLRDRTGLLQLVFHPETAPEAHTVAGELRAEDVLSARGTIVDREPENVNPQMPTGEVELDVAAVAKLADADTPPFPIDEERELDELLRMRHRPLDLRRERQRDTLLLRHRAAQTIRRTLDELDFVEIETPMLTRSTPEGARDFLVPARIQPGSFYALPQSPQILARVFEVAEFDVPAPPWPRLPYDHALATYGVDRPDRRFGMEIVDVGDALAGSAFQVFAKALQGGGVIRGINAGRREVARSELDGLTELAQRLGAKGLVWAFVEDGGTWRCPVAKFLRPEEMSAVSQRLGAEPGDLLLAVADSPEVTAAVLGGLRLELAERFALVSDGAHDIHWIVDFPMFEWNPQEERWDPLHHPFTAPVGDLDDPGSLRSRGYDLVLDGFEIGGGSIRSHRLDVQRRVFELIGISDREAQERFGFLLEALRYGAPPHGGIALGFDRIVSILAGWRTLREVNIRESITFPKTASGLDPLTGAPAEVDERQLRELGIRVAPVQPPSRG